MSSITSPETEIIYPESDGKRKAENDRQYLWIVMIRENLGILFKDRTDVYVAADHLIYVEKGNRILRQAPDVYVAFGRSKGIRGSYLLWNEANIFPQVVFEILSPGNRPGEMAEKMRFYEHYGAEEYYLYDPDRIQLCCYLRDAEGTLQLANQGDVFTSPRLGIRFDMSEPELVIYYPDGRRFHSSIEWFEQLEEEHKRAEAEQKRATVAQKRAENEQKRAEAAQLEVERMRALLRAAGIDPDAGA